MFSRYWRVSRRQSETPPVQKERRAEFISMGFPYRLRLNYQGNPLVASRRSGATVAAMEIRYRIFKLPQVFSTPLPIPWSPDTLDRPSPSGCGGRRFNIVHFRTKFLRPCRDAEERIARSFSHNFDVSFAFAAFLCANSSRLRRAASQASSGINFLSGRRAVGCGESKVSKGTRGHHWNHPIKIDFFFALSLHLRTAIPP